MTHQKKKPRIIVWDLETGNFNANLSSIICFGWKVLGSRGQPHCKNTWDYKGWRKNLFGIYDDKKLVEYIYSILVDADGIVTHYGKGFDLRFLNSRLVYHGLPPLPPMMHIDTWATARYKLKLHSNRLDAVAGFFGLDQKTSIVKEAQDRGLHIEHKWHLWVLTSQWNKKALKLMSDYCKQDVAVLEQVYFKILPLMGESVNYNMFKKPGVKQHVCPKCGSPQVHKRGIYRTKVNSFQRYQCQECGSWFRTASKDKKPRGL